LYVTSHNRGGLAPGRVSAIQSGDVVWVILLNYMSADDTINCWYSLKSLVTPCHVIVVDNCSPDDSANRILQHVPAAHFLVNRCNRGFAAGNNAGIQRAIAAGARYVWLLNNDTTVEPDTLAALLATVDQDPLIAVVGSTILEIQDRSTLQCRGGGRISFWSGHSWNVRAMTEEPMFITGASMLLRVSALDESLMDEGFFFLWEDVDLCLRLKANGWKLAVSDRSVVYHRGGGSEPMMSAKRLEWHSFGLVRLLRRHGRFAFICSLPIWVFYVMKAAQCCSVRMLIGCMSGWIKGWITPLRISKPQSDIEH